MAFAVDDLGEVIRGAGSAVDEPVAIKAGHVGYLQLDRPQLELRIFDEQCRSRTIGLTPDLIEKIGVIGFLDTERRAID